MRGSDERDLLSHTSRGWTVLNMVSLGLFALEDCPGLQVVTFAVSSPCATAALAFLLQNPS